jgi:hypothetical protein
MVDHTPQSIPYGPHWFVVLVASLVGALPWAWKYQRFSLRTLLIATTLVAVGLGVVVWLR